MEGNSQIDLALAQKKPPPEMDFTLHVMEDGSEVSTQERVCKGAMTWSYLKSWPLC